jgi:5'(3')-deoxyribonucleotidase
MMIDPESLAFDFDGVLADTMTLFIDIAREEYHINGIRYKDMTSYNLQDCLEMDPEIIFAIIVKILEGNYSATLKPMAYAPEILARINRYHNPILLVTARPHADPVHDWVQEALPLDPASIEVVATGTFEGKAEVLLNRKISFFVEDRLETCFSIMEAGITPVVYRQPWNRKSHPFVEVGNWCELASLIDF